MKVSGRGAWSKSCELCSTARRMAAEATISPAARGMATERRRAGQRKGVSGVGSVALPTTGRREGADAFSVSAP